MAGIIDSRPPLEPGYIPARFIGRDAEQDALTTIFGVESDARLQHVHVSGPRGTGKTHLLRRFLTTFPPTFTTCYLSGLQQNTQYKALERLYQRLTGTELGTGFHVADIQRRLQDQITLPTVIVLDEIDFLLLNDGDDLLYFLTRLENTAVVTASAKRSTLKGDIDDRTYSSFQPQHLTLNPYTLTEAHQILADRARKSLEPQSLHRAALGHIAATTQNIAIGLAWLRVAAENADTKITKNLVEDTAVTAYDEYATHLLADFTPHHRRLYEAIDRLEQAQESPLTTGSVYEEYRAHCAAADVASLSERRISDFLRHLELIDLIEANYHYGGPKGKTREINLVEWRSRSDSD